MPGTLEHEDERNPLLGGKLHQAIALVRCSCPYGATKHREVLCGRNGRSTVDRSNPANEGVGRGVRRARFGLVPDQRTELDERPRVEESRQALSCVELAGRTMLGEAFLAAHSGGLGTLRSQLIQKRSPFIPSGRGFHKLYDKGADEPAGVLAPTYGRCRFGLRLDLYRKSSLMLLIDSSALEASTKPKPSKAFLPARLLSSLSLTQSGPDQRRVGVGRGPRLLK
jgi:hypothetical protein